MRSFGKTLRWEDAPLGRRLAPGKTLCWEDGCAWEEGGVRREVLRVGRLSISRAFSAWTLVVRIQGLRPWLIYFAPSALGWVAWKVFFSYSTLVMVRPLAGISAEIVIRFCAGPVAQGCQI